MHNDPAAGGGNKTQRARCLSRKLTSADRKNRRSPSDGLDLIPQQEGTLLFLFSSSSPSLCDNQYLKQGGIYAGSASVK